MGHGVDEADLRIEGAIDGRDTPGPGLAGSAGGARKALPGGPLGIVARGERRDPPKGG